MKIILVARCIVAVVVISSMTLAGCTTQATISGKEISNVVIEQASGEALYSGCFWCDRLWEEEWSIKKSRRNTLKEVRVRIAPWQSLVSVCSLGFWVPMYVEWELNGD